MELGEPVGAQRDLNTLNSFLVEMRSHREAVVELLMWRLV